MGDNGTAMLIPRQLQKWTPSKGDDDANTNTAGKSYLSVLVQIKTAQGAGNVDPDGPGDEGKVEPDALEVCKLMVMDLWIRQVKIFFPVPEIQWRIGTSATPRQLSR